MVLGIKLEIDKTSLKQINKSLKDGFDKGATRVKKTFGIGTGVGAIVGAEIGAEEGQDNGKKKKGKSDKGILSSAAIGGFIGAIVGSMKPVQELLGVIAGILSIFLVPILILMKPFLALFLAVGMLLYDAFSSDTNMTKREKADNRFSTIVGSIAAVVAAIVAALAGAPGLIIAAIAVAVLLLGKYLVEFGMKIGQLLWDYVLVPLFEFGSQIGQWLYDKVIVPIANAVTNGILWLVNSFKVAIDWLQGAWNSVVTFVKNIPEYLSIGVQAVANFFMKTIPELFLKGLEPIRKLGKLIWDYIKSALSSLVGGGKTRSVDDALISSSGDITKLNPNDNVLAFQDFSQVMNVASSVGGSSGGVTIQVQGFVGDENKLANIVAKALSKSGRGGLSQFR